MNDVRDIVEDINLGNEVIPLKSNYTSESTQTSQVQVGQTELNKIKKQLLEKDQIINNLQQKESRLIKQNSEYLQEINDLEVEVDKSNHEISAISLENIHIQNKFGSCLTENDKLMKDNSKLQRDIVAMKGSHQTLVNEKDRVISDCRSQIDKVKKSYKKLEKINAEAKNVSPTTKNSTSKVNSVVLSTQTDLPVLSDSEMKEAMGEFKMKDFFKMFST